MIRCRTCLYPNTKPDLHFDETGECSACTSAKKKEDIDWDYRYDELMQLLDKHHGEVLVPSSGGKDSTFQAITLKNMGAHVTAITARTCHLTPIGRRNIDNLSKHVKTIEYVPNMSVRAKLNRFGLEMVGDISHPEHMAIFTTPFRAAVDLKTPLIMYGENPQNAYGGPKGTDEAKQMTRQWTQEYGGFLGLRPSDFIGMEGITKRDMSDYELPKQVYMDAVGVEAHFLGQYMPWDSHENAELAIKYGMEYGKPAKNAWWDMENLDNAQTGLHDYVGYRKYGYGRYTAQISIDIRNRFISRNTALSFLKKQEYLFPYIYAGVSIEEMLDRIGLTLKQLYPIMDNFTNWEIFRRVEDNEAAMPILI